LQISFDMVRLLLSACFRFIVKEGLAILISWLGEAAAEEQTSVILTIFKVGTGFSFIVCTCVSCILEYVILNNQLLSCFRFTGALPSSTE
jgi:hypothetical protein